MKSLFPGPIFFRNDLAILIDRSAFFWYNVPGNLEKDSFGEKMQINTFLETLRFRQDQRSSGIGNVKNYYITFFPGRYGYSIVPYFTLPINETIDPEQIAKLQAALDVFDIIVKKENDVLVLIVNHSLAFIKPEEAARLGAALEKATGFLTEFGFTQPRLCSICGQPGADSYVYAHGVHRPCHGACLPEEPDSGTLSHPEPLPAEDLGARALSVILSLSLGIIFSIPAVVSAIYYPIFYTFLLIFIPLGGILGVKWGHTNVTSKTYRDLNVLSYTLGMALMIWRLNLSVAAQGGITSYFVSLANWGASILDLVIGSLVITLGMALFRPLLPIRKL